MSPHQSSRLAAILSEYEEPKPSAFGQLTTTDVQGGVTGNIEEIQQIVESERLRVLSEQEASEQESQDDRNPWESDIFGEDDGALSMLEPGDIEEGQSWLYDLDVDPGDWHIDTETGEILDAEMVEPDNVVGFTQLEIAQLVSGDTLWNGTTWGEEEIVNTPQNEAEAQEVERRLNEGELYDELEEEDQG